MNLIKPINSAYSFASMLFPCYFLSLWMALLFCFCFLLLFFFFHFKGLLLDVSIVTMCDADDMPHNA